MFENKIIKGVHASRYIMSYLRSGGEIKYRDKLKEWLKSIPWNLTEEEIDYIVDMYGSGKLELEDHAKEFLKNYKEPEYEI